MLSRCIHIITLPDSLSQVLIVICHYHCEKQLLEKTSSHNIFHRCVLRRLLIYPLGWYYFLFFSSLFIGIFNDYLAVTMKEFISDCFKKAYKSYLNMLLYNQSCQIPLSIIQYPSFWITCVNIFLSQDKRIHKTIRYWKQISKRFIKEGYFYLFLADNSNSPWCCIALCFSCQIKQLWCHLLEFLMIA